MAPSAQAWGSLSRVIDEAAVLNAKILVVDDEESNLVLLERLLARHGFSNVTAVADSREAVGRFEAISPDLVITDLRMPYMDGFELIEAINARLPADSFVPIIVVTADLSRDLERRVLSLGARDFLNKPFNATQVTLRVRNLLQTRLLHVALKRHNEMLEERVRERTIELEAARTDILERLAMAAEYRDVATSRHTQRVGYLAERIARKLGIDAEAAELLRRAAPLHDVGKIGIPDDILLKPGRLTEDEFEAMKMHVALGVKLLSKGQSDLIKLAELIAKTHHERYDGSGYPSGLTGERIPIEGQIVAVADVFDTLISHRPYKEPWPVECAVAEIRHRSGTWFSPRVVHAFLQVLGEEPEILVQAEQFLCQSPAPPQSSD